MQALAAAHAFVLVGAERLTGEAEPLPAGGELDTRIRRLLSGHNHILRRDAEGRVAKVIVIGVKPDPGTVARGIAIPTRRARGTNRTRAASIRSSATWAHM